MNVKESRASLLSMALVIALSSGGCSSRATGIASAPTGWEKHEDPSGFIVQTPPGWKVETPPDRPILLYNADRSAFTAIQPFIALKDETAPAILRQIPESLAALFPSARITNLTERRPETEKAPGEATAEMQFTANSAPMTANLQCTLYKRSAMFYAIAAPTDRFAKSRETLVRVLASFLFTKPAHAVATPPAQEWTSWRDPREGAFTLEAPKGWKLDGGTFRMASVDVRTEIRAASPDGNTRIVGGDQNIGAFCLPNSMLEYAGIHEGNDYSPGYGVHMIVRRYQSGVAFAMEHVKASLGKDLSNLQFTNHKTRPELADKLNRIFAQFSNGLSVHLEAGEVTFTGTSNGRPRQGYCFAGTLLAQGQGNGIWNVPFLYGYVSAPDQADQAEGLMKHMVETFRVDKEWEERQQNTTMQTSRIVTQANNEIMAIWRSAQARSSSSRKSVGEDPHDAIMRRWSNYLRGEETVYDPDSGDTWQVESGHNFYFARSTATSPQFAGNESGNVPDSRYHEVVVVH